MGKLKGLWDLIRLDHGLMLAVAVFIGAVIAQKGIPTDLWKLTLATLTAVFLEISTFALNDYYDYPIDKRNNRADRPLVRGDLAPSTAVAVTLTFFPLGIITAFFVNYVCFLIALITGVFALLYDIKFKKIKLVSNYYIAYTMAIPFLFGGVAFSPDIPPIIWILSSMAFLSGVGREILKDVMDLEGDKEGAVKSLPIYFGKYNSFLITGVFFVSAVSMSLIPFFLNIDPSFYKNNLYLISVSVPDLLFLGMTTVLLLKSNPPVKLFRKMTLIAMMLGLGAFLIGSLA
ncbi:MAG: UbiA family prenyltransferase [Candidatus Saliniplasma sp.]